jgi:hypothetical protein
LETDGETLRGLSRGNRRGRWPPKLNGNVRNQSVAESTGSPSMLSGPVVPFSTPDTDTVGVQMTS